MTVRAILWARHAATGDCALAGKPLTDALPALGEWLRRTASEIESPQGRAGTEPSAPHERAGGTARYFMYPCEPLGGAGGAAVGVVTLTIDVTERGEARAFVPQPWLEATFDAIGTPVVLADPDTRRIVFANARAQAISRGELWPGALFSRALGLDVGYYFTDAAGNRLAEEELPAWRAARGEVVDGMEILWHVPSGVTSLMCFAERVPASEGLPPLVVLSFFDVSPLRRIERELQATAEARDEFLLLAGHELRTPLTALKLQSTALRRAHPELAGLASVERAVSRMETLVEQILTAVRILASDAHTAPEELDLWRVVDDVLDELHLEAQRSECRVTRGGAREVRGRWDRTLLEQSITNLLRNAFRFGAGKPVTIACEDLGDHASLTVSDEGPGIDPADQERIFERFERAVSSRRYGGLGLGLWVTREMVMRMGGAIRVRSAVGEGAAFTIELPKKGA